MQTSEKIKKLCEFRNFTQEYMANQLSMSQNSYSRLERAGDEVSIAQLSKIAHILHLRVADILNFDESQVVLNINKVKNENGKVGVIYEQGMSAEEKQLFQELIKQLKEENIYLKRIIDSTMPNSA